MVRAHISFDSRELRRNLKELEGKADRIIGAVIEYHAVEGEAELKTKAPWTDRTGAARTGLHTATAHQGGTHTIVFAHSVPYGIWLEIKNSGRYEVIMPTVRTIGPRVMQSLDGLFGRMR